MANALTILRVVLIPVFVYLKLSPVPGGKWFAAAAFGVAALTDLFDGILARRTDTVTPFGKIADPLADRALILTVLVVLVLTGQLPLWAAAIVAARDFVMMFGYKLVQARGLTPEVSFLGKVSTTVLMVSIALVIVDIPGGVYVFYAGMALSVASGVQYGRDAFAETFRIGGRHLTTGRGRGEG